MAEVSIDFGTSNTLVARWNQTVDRAETLAVPEISTKLSYRLVPGGPKFSVWAIPSMIHFGEKVLIGDQVISGGLAEHSHTMRWMKRSIANGSTKRTKTAQGQKSASEAGQEFLRRVLTYAVPQISLQDDNFTFTVPVEAFEDFQDWIWRVAEDVGIKKIRVLDEPTASVFGYHGAARAHERFVVFDFGGGTLDVAAVRLEPLGAAGRKAIQLGMAGAVLGGMNIDMWLADAFRKAHSLDGSTARDLENLILREAESVKVQLSDPEETEAEMRVLDDSAHVPRLLRSVFVRACPTCDPAATKTPLPKKALCFGCLLLANDFQQRVRDTLDRAIENAAIRSGMRRSEITRVLVTGGTSLVPAVRKLLTAAFGDKVQYDHPFDCVVRGACRGVVEPVLLHDYAIESYNRKLKRYEFQELFKIGSEYPTSVPVEFWCNGSADGMTRIGILVFEVSRMVRRAAEESILDAEGRLRSAAKVVTDFEHVCLNSESPTFIDAVPPVNRERDKERFLCSFEIDGNRRLLVTVYDHLAKRTVLKSHPVVRL